MRAEPRQTENTFCHVYLPDSMSHNVGLKTTLAVIFPLSAHLQRLRVIPVSSKDEWWNFFKATLTKRRSVSVLCVCACVCVLKRKRSGMWTWYDLRYFAAFEKGVK